MVLSLRYAYVHHYIHATTSTCVCVHTVCVCMSLYPLTGHYMRTETNLPSSKAAFQALVSLANLAAKLLRKMGR